MRLILKENRAQRFLFNLLLIGFIQLISLQLSHAQKKQQKKPNFIFILTDDQRYDLLGTSGNELIKTPHLDQLANEGVLFTNLRENIQ